MTCTTHALTQEVIRSSSWDYQVQTVCTVYGRSPSNGLHVDTTA